MNKNKVTLKGIGKILKYTVFILTILLSIGTVVSSAQETQTADSIKTVPDTLLSKIQKAQSAITDVNTANNKGYNIDGLKKTLDAIKDNVEPLEAAFKGSKDKIDTRSLQSYSLILKDASQQLSALQDILIKNNAELQGMSQQITDLSSDPILTVTRKDDAEKKLYQGQLTEIKSRLQEGGKLTGTNLDQVSRLLAEASALDIVINDLQAQTNELLQRSSRLAFSKEAPYLWQAPLSDATDQGIGELLSSSFLGQQQILAYFISTTWDNRVLTILLAAVFFIWVYKNFRIAARTKIKRQIGELNFEYIAAYPILATVLVLFNITPLLEPDSPSLYIEIIQLLMLLTMTLHLRAVLPPKQLHYWLFIIGLYIVMILTDAVVKTALPLRALLVLLNVIFIYLGVLMRKNVTIPQFSRSYVKGVITLFIVFNVIGLLLNIFGRVSLSQVISLTGLIGLTQMIGLAVFTQIILDALELQIKISSCSNGIFSRVSHANTRAAAKKALSVLAIVLWVMVFLTNLSLTSGVFSFFASILTKSRGFGSIHFTLGNILLFGVIVYLSNQLQKNVPVLFGEGRLTYDGAVEHKSSKVALIRLIVVLIGVLLAVTASGLPMDRLTVILGALGVGIGLGLQNIVNNFVSGVILIFEKPFRIGDYVELADKKGKVKDIGIRSSTLLTPEGSEVIIPNGDLLSGRLVNWTLSHDYVKTDFTFKVSIETDLEALRNIIGEEVKHMDKAMPDLPAEVLVNAVAAGAIEIKVLVWINSIYSEPGFKSALMGNLIKRMAEAEIKIL